ncbi:hypothetical protein [Scytonema millei]|uniref:Uncharacterized protein n=1 Tax=Scytonema millei VB511283 TaxID=1245923 RepID=A0A9X5E6Q3_9CYAN|nr:hypothetical protein [Scytonema millei]NHC36325.1 hypothetical protein [Scytonema millei VB511283]
MTNETTIQFTFGLDNLELEDDERQKFAQRLLPELRSLDEVIRADRAENLDPEAGSKGFATLVGLLQAEVGFKSIKAFVGFLGDRLADKPVKVKVKVGDKEAEIEAKSRQELAELEKIALNLIAAMGGGSGV